jgi:hypothetical protein
MKDPGFALYFRRYAPFKTFGRANPLTAGFGTFAGDNRGVSTSLKATSRTYGFVMFNRDGLVHSFASSSGTHFHPAIGAVIVSTAKVRHTAVRTTLAGPSLFGFRASTAANVPLIPGSPDINTFVECTVNYGVRDQLRIAGETFGDNFPNLEVFLVCFASARTALLLDGQTSGGPHSGPATRLFGSKEFFSLAKFSANLSLNQKGELASDYKVAPTPLREYAGL